MGQKKEFKIPVLVDGVKIGQGRWGQLEVELEFKTPESVVAAAIDFLEQIEECQEIVQRMTECVDKTPTVYGDFRKKLVQILEEKYGLKVRVCGNCRFFYFRISGGGDGECHQETIHEPLGIPQKTFGYCEHWAPKEKEVRVIRLPEQTIHIKKMVPLPS